MKKVEKIVYVLALVSLVALPLLSGCAPAEEVTPAVEKPEKFIFRVMYDITGPYGAVMATVSLGIHDALDYINEEGGINGVPVEVETFDTTNERAVAMGKYMEWREAKPPFIFPGQVADCEMLIERANEDKIMLFSSLASDRVLWPPQYYFCPFLDAADEAGYTMDYISEEWRKSGQSRKCRLAILNPDYPLGHAYASPALMDYIKAKGNIEVVDVEFCDFRATDVSTELTRISAYDPDWIFSANLYGLFSVTLKGAHALGMLDKVRFATANWNMEPLQTRLCGKEIVEGIVGTCPLLQWTDDEPGMRIIREGFARNNRTEEDRGYFYWFAWISTAGMLGIVEQVVNKYGWDGLTGSHLLEAVETIDRINPWGIQEFVLSGKKHSCKQARMYQFKNGEVVAIGDWGLAPDLRPAEWRKAEYGWKD